MKARYAESLVPTSTITTDRERTIPGERLAGTTPDSTARNRPGRGTTLGWWIASTLPTTGCLKKPKTIALCAASPWAFEICAQTVSLGCAHQRISFIRLRHGREPVDSSIRFEDKTSAMACMKFSGGTIVGKRSRDRKISACRRAHQCFKGMKAVLAEDLTDRRFPRGFCRYFRSRRNESSGSNGFVFSTATATFDAWAILCHFAPCCSA